MDNINSLGDINKPVSTVYGDHLVRFVDIWKSQLEQLKLKFGDLIEEVRMPGDWATDVPIVYVKKDWIVDVLRFAKVEAQFEYQFLSDITATDEEVSPRFEVVYQLYSHVKGCRIRFKCRVEEGQSVPTLVTVWPAANWAEREVWDMFGIQFAGHPDLRRILMDERWQGYPLRKDYPLRGYQLFPTPMPAHPELLE